MRAPEVGVSVLSFRETASEDLVACLAGLHSEGVAIRIIHRIQGSPIAQREEGQLAEGTPYLSIRHPENHGFALGHNRNVEELQECSFLWILNDDVSFDPGTLGTLLRFLARYPDCVVAGPEIIPWNPRECKAEALQRRHDVGIGWYQRSRGVVRQLKSDGPREEFAGYSFVSGCAPLWRSEAFRLLGGFWGPLFLYHEDSELSIRVAALFGPRAIGLCSDAKVFHYEAGSSTTRRWVDPKARPDRSDLFDYFDMRNGAVLIQLHSGGNLERITATCFYLLRLLRKLLRPWAFRESAKLRKNLFALLGTRDGLLRMNRGNRNLDRRIDERLASLARPDESPGRR